MLHNQSILIVEDDPLIALCLAEAVELVDGRVIGPVPTVREALALLEELPIAAAIIDANLADRDVTPVGLLLAEKGVPFVVHTGSGPPQELLAELGSLIVVAKPASSFIVVERLCEEMLQPRELRMPVGV